MKGLKLSVTDSAGHTSEFWKIKNITNNESTGSIRIELYKSEADFDGGCCSVQHKVIVFEDADGKNYSDAYTYVKTLDDVDGIDFTSATDVN